MCEVCAQGSQRTLPFRREDVRCVLRVCAVCVCDVWRVCTCVCVCVCQREDVHCVCVPVCVCHGAKPDTANTDMKPTYLLLHSSLPPTTTPLDPHPPSPSPLPLQESFFPPSLSPLLKPGRRVERVSTPVQRTCSNRKVQCVCVVCGCVCVCCVCVLCACVCRVRACGGTSPSHFPTSFSWSSLCV